MPTEELEESPSKSSEIRRELGDTAGCLKFLAEAVEKLEMRVGPVLAEESPPDKESTEKAAEPNLCPLAKDIRELKCGIRKETNHIRDIIKRIEL